MECATVGDAKEAGAPDAKVASTPVDAGYAKGLASSVEDASFIDAKEDGDHDAKEVSTPIDSGSFNNVATDEGMYCCL